MDQKISESTLQRAKSDIVGTISKYVDIKERRRVFCMLPIPQRKTPSFSVVPAKDFYYCHGCGAGGNAIDFVMQYENLGFRQAVAQILGELPVGDNVPVQKASTRVEEKPDWTPIVPVPADTKLKPKDIFNRKVDGQWQTMTATKRWEYLDLNGELIGYISRFEKPEGGKEVMPQSFCVNTDTGEMAWRWLSFAAAPDVWPAQADAVPQRAGNAG